MDIISSINNYDVFDEGFGIKKKPKTRKERRKINSSNMTKPSIPSLLLKEINPKTLNQQKTFDSYNKNQNLIQLGCAGVGKTFLAMYLALNDILNNKLYKKLMIVRSPVSARNIGFLPGSAEEKMKIFESPYISICSNLFGRGDAYSILKTKGIIEFESTSFMRGETFDNAIVIFDEIQNCGFHELQTVITRLGTNSKIVMCGDFGQTDLTQKHDPSGLERFARVCHRMKEFDFIEYNTEDIVRSGIVKSWYVALDKDNSVSTFISSEI